MKECQCLSRHKAREQRRRAYQCSWTNRRLSIRACATAPSQRKCADLLHALLTALDDEFSAIDIRIQNRHRAIIEEKGVVIVRRTAKQLDIERTFAFLQAELLFNRLSLQERRLGSYRTLRNSPRLAIHGSNDHKR